MKRFNEHPWTKNNTGPLKDKKGQEDKRHPFGPTEGHLMLRLMLGVSLLTPLLGFLFPPASSSFFHSLSLPLHSPLPPLLSLSFPTKSPSYIFFSFQSTETNKEELTASEHFTNRVNSPCSEAWTRSRTLICRDHRKGFLRKQGTGAELFCVK